MLLEKGANVHKAVKLLLENDHKAVKLLLENGADVHSF